MQQPKQIKIAIAFLKAGYVFVQPSSYSTSEMTLPSSHGVVGELPLQYWELLLAMAKEQEKGDNALEDSDLMELFEGCPKLIFDMFQFEGCGPAWYIVAAGNEVALRYRSGLRAQYEQTILEGRYKFKLTNHKGQLSEVEKRNPGLLASLNL